MLQKIIWHAKRIFRTTSSPDSPTAFRERLTNGVEFRLISPRVRKQSADYSPPRSHAEAARRQIDRIREAMGNDARVQVHPNAMAAGPCNACIAISREPIPLDEAPLGPLSECPHPDQCVLIFAAVMPWD